MSVIPALFHMLQVEIHMRMCEICQQICANQNFNFNAQHSIELFYFIIIIIKEYAEKWYHLLH